MKYFLIKSSHFFIFIFIRLFLEQSYSCNYRPVKVHRKIGNTVGMNANLELLIAYCTGDGQKTHFYWKWWSLEEQSYKTSEIWTGWRVSMAVRVVEFSNGGSKLERFLPKNQHTQRELMNFENWVNGEVSNSAKIWLSKSIFYVKHYYPIFFFILEYQFKSIFFITFFW